MRRYWLEFDLPADQPHPMGAAIGCGVTADSYDDCLSLLRDRVFSGTLPIITRVVEDVDVSTLDPGRVLPNMGLVTMRGVWFPKGLDVAEL